MNKRFIFYSLALIFLLLIQGNMTRNTSPPPLNQTANTIINVHQDVSSRIYWEPYNITAELIPLETTETPSFTYEHVATLKYSDYYVQQQSVEFSNIGMEAYFYVLIDYGISLIRTHFFNGTTVSYTLISTNTGEGYGFVSSDYNPYARVYAATVANSTTLILGRLNVTSREFTRTFISLSEFSNEGLTTVKVAPNGDVFIGGYRETPLEHTFGSDITDALIMKFNSTLNREWTQTFDYANFQINATGSERIERVVDFGFKDQISSNFYVLIAGNEPACAYGSIILLNISSNGDFLDAVYYEDEVLTPNFVDLVSDYPAQLQLYNNSFYVVGTKRLNDCLSNQITKLQIVVFDSSFTLSQQIVFPESNLSDYSFIDSQMILSWAMNFQGQKLLVFGRDKDSHPELFIYDPKTQQLSSLGILPEDDVHYYKFTTPINFDFSLISNNNTDPFMTYFHHEFNLYSLPTIPEINPNSILLYPSVPSVSFSWNQSESNSGPILSYQVNITTSTNTSMKTVDGEFTFYNYSLPLGDTQFTVRAYDGKIYSPWSSMLRIHVQRSPPPAPHNLQLSYQSNSSSIELSWEHDLYANEPSLHFEIYGNNTVNTTASLLGVTSELSYTVSNICTNTTYMFYIIAITEYSMSTPSSIISITIPAPEITTTTSSTTTSTTITPPSETTSPSESTATPTSSVSPSPPPLPLPLDTIMIFIGFTVILISKRQKQ